MNIYGKVILLYGKDTVKTFIYSRVNLIYGKVFLYDRVFSIYVKISFCLGNLIAGKEVENVLVVENICRYWRPHPQRRIDPSVNSF